MRIYGITRLIKNCYRLDEYTALEADKGTLIAQGGDTYPVTFGNDTSGRRTQLTTLYGETDASASTQWKYNPSTGLLTNKLDAAGKGAAYTYTADGRPLRTTWARSNAWKENAYDQRGLVCSNRYSVASMNVSYTYTAAGLPSLVSSTLGFSTGYVYNDSLILTNETVTGLDVPDSVFEIRRTSDARQRPSVMSLAHNGTNLTQVAYGYDSEYRLSTIACTNAHGRGFTLEYSYSGNYGTGYTLSTPTNAVIETILTRNAYRRHQVTEISTTFNTVEITAHSYYFDDLGRATNAVRSIQPLSLVVTNLYAYNARSEVVVAGIDTNDYAYIYDSLGNNLYTSVNAVTNAYTVNNLNQYKAVTNLLALSGIGLDHDADGNTTLIGEHELAYDDENRLSLYLFGWEPFMTGTIQNAYIHDHLGRRVKKMVQELRVDDPGGMMPPTYWWQTNAVTTYIYDGWNLSYESTAFTNGTIQEVTYFWGKDISGSLQGAGGVGGLLAVSIAGDYYFPCYDNHGNITAYIDESGTVVAYRQYDAFGNTLAKGGAMVDVFHFWYSTKYLDHDTGLYYYGYRYYSPILQRWINRDPIEEGDSFNLYNFVSNNSVQEIDPFGLWKKGETINDGRRRIYIKEADDTFEALAKIVGLELGEIHKWARFEGLDKSKSSSKCSVSVPNVWISADLLRGGTTYSEFVSIGGSIGQFFGTDLLTYGFKIEKPTTIQQLASSLGRNQKDVWGITVFGHGDKWGRLGASTTSKTRGIDWIPQKWLIPYVDYNGYKLAKIYMMQCYSKYKGSVTIPGTTVTQNVDYESMWKQRAVENGFFGYLGVNGLGVDWH